MYKKIVSKRAFTLIELLVVIAIIGILAAILFPVFARARENARRASCMSNLKQIDLGLMMYAQDYDGQLFGWSYGAATIGALGYNSFWAPINKPPMTYTSISWFFEPYIKNSQVFYCPSFSEPQIGYGYNSVLRYGMAQAAIEYPSQMVAFMDENYSSYLTYSPTSANWNANFCRTPNTTSCAEADRYYGRHLGGVNVAFVDGHVKWMHIETLYNGGNDKPYFDGRS